MVSFSLLHFQPVDQCRRCSTDVSCLVLLILLARCLFLFVSTYSPDVATTSHQRKRSLESFTSRLRDTIVLSSIEPAVISSQALHQGPKNFVYSTFMIR